jgi:hypothetical protein
MVRSSKVQALALIMAGVAVIATIAGTTLAGKSVRITSNTVIACAISAVFWYVVVICAAALWGFVAHRR